MPDNRSYLEPTVSVRLFASAALLTVPAFSVSTQMPADDSLAQPRRSGPENDEDTDDI